MLVQRQLSLHGAGIENDVAVVSSTIQARLRRSQTYMSVLSNKWHDDVREHQIRESRARYAKCSIHVQLSESFERQRRGRRRGWRPRIGRMLGCSRRRGRHRCAIAIDIDPVYMEIEPESGGVEVLHAGCSLNLGIIESQLQRRKLQLFFGHAEVGR